MSTHGYPPAQALELAPVYRAGQGSGISAAAAAGGGRVGAGSTAGSAIFPSGMGQDVHGTPTRRGNGSNPPPTSARAAAAMGVLASPSQMASGRAGAPVQVGCQHWLNVGWGVSMD